MGPEGPVGRSLRPTHVGIIMDGSARWAEARGLPREEGHRAGYRNLPRVIEACRDAGVRYLTLFAFSTENWRRHPAEVAALMDLFTRFFLHEAPRWVAAGVNVRAIGRLHPLPTGLQAAIARAEALRRPGAALELLVAVGYGGRAEVADAVRRAYEAGDVAALLDAERHLARYLYAPDVPAADLIIRTGGERRLSNFLLWQAAYAEIVFCPTLWPDFGPEELAEALADFARRERRFGSRPAARAGDGRPPTSTETAWVPPSLPAAAP
jgi:undecaprenyl diphosphate synthase